MSVIPAVEWWKQKDQEFKVILTYLASSKPAWDMHHPVSKREWEDTPCLQDENWELCTEPAKGSFKPPDTVKLLPLNCTLSTAVYKQLAAQLHLFVAWQGLRCRGKLVKKHVCFAPFIFCQINNWTLAWSPRGWKWGFPFHSCINAPDRSVS